MALTFKKIARLSTNELVIYYNSSMQASIEVADTYARNRKKNQDLELRINPSSLPCCPILNTFAAVSLLRATDTTTAQASGFGNTYAGLGSIRHEVCQQFLGRSGRIYGDWWCPRCGKVQRQSLYKLCKCGEFPLYQEMRFTHTYKGKTVKSFKPDGIFIDSKRRLWVLDYKFVTGHKVTKTKVKDLPARGNRKQVLDYVHTLRLLDGKFKDVAGYILLYVAFDQVMLESGFGYHVVQRRVSKTATRKYAKKLESEYRKLLLSRKAAHAVVDKVIPLELVKQLVENKPCRSFEHYQETMHNQYSPCPYALNGECFKPKFVKQLNKDLKALSCA